MAAIDGNEVRQRRAAQGGAAEDAPSAEPWARAEQEEEEVRREATPRSEEPGPTYNLGEDSGALPAGDDGEGGER